MSILQDFKINLISEGVNDPAIFKVVFLAGGPGSGKSFIVGKTGLSALGFTVVNSDAPFEYLMRKLGLDFKMPDSEKEVRDAARERAKATAKAKLDLSLEGRLGMVIDGTGKDFEKIQRMRQKLAQLGYDASMIFVNTNVETALARNKKRARSVPNEVAKKGWQDVQDNIGKFTQAFGDKFYVIDNSEGSDYEKQTNYVYKRIAQWVRTPPTNAIGRNWISSQRKSAGMSEMTDDEYLLALYEGEACSVVSQEQIKDLEKFADNLLKKFDIDVEFTRHFGERMSDSRNNPCIKVNEIQKLFKKIAKDRGQKILQHKNSEAVLKDIQSELNLPFVLNVKKNGEFELVAKTIMRKKNFSTPNPEVKYEAYTLNAFRRKHEHDLDDLQIIRRDKLISQMVANPTEYKEKYGSEWLSVITHAATRLVLTGHDKDHDHDYTEEEPELSNSDGDAGGMGESIVVNANRKQETILSKAEKGNANRDVKLKTSLPEEEQVKENVYTKYKTKKKESKNEQK